MNKFALTMMLAVGTAFNALAEVPPELQGFEFLEDVLPKDEFGSVKIKQSTKRSMQKDIIPLIEDSILEAAAYNIHNPEQVFCYHVEKRKKGDEAYTIGNYKVVDYCGELDFDVLTTTYEALFTRSPNIITTVAKCKIEPKVMLRFVRGVDYTDVLMSSPCPSFTVFYAGRYKSFNIKQGIIDDLISQFENKREEFLSPALIKQTASNGKPESAEDAYKLEKEQKKIDEAMEAKSGDGTNNEPAPKIKKGWGKIKLNM